jgi:hypothetical protein
VEDSVAAICEFEEAVERLDAVHLVMDARGNKVRRFSKRAYV